MTKVKLYIYSVLACTFLVMGCEKLEHNNPENDQTDLLEIHLQERFKDNNVRVELNGNMIFEDEISSNRAGLAKIFVFKEEVSFDPEGVVKAITEQVSKGEHDLRVWVDDTLTSDTKFILADTLFIGVRYNMDSDHKIEIRLREKRFTYH